MPALLLLPDAPRFTIADVNTAYLEITGQKEAGLPGKSILEVSPGKPSDITPNHVADLQQSLPTIQILFRKQIERSAVIHVDQLPVLKAYKAPLRQVFQNLVSNALKYVRAGISSQIQITVRELKTQWQFAVNDNGIGIGKDHFDKIFILFQRLHNKMNFQEQEWGWQ